MDMGVRGAVKLDSFLMFQYLLISLSFQSTGMDFFATYPNITWNHFFIVSNVKAFNLTGCYERNVWVSPELTC